MASKLLLLALLAVLTIVALSPTTIAVTATNNNNATTTQPTSADSDRPGTVTPGQLSAPALEARSVHNRRPNMGVSIVIPGARPVSEATRPSVIGRPRPAGVATGAFATPRPLSGVTGLKPKPRPGTRPSAHINRDGLIGADAARVPS